MADKQVDTAGECMESAVGETSDWTGSTSRRNLLRVTGGASVGVALGLAGCSGSDEEQTTNSDSDDTDQNSNDDGDNTAGGNPIDAFHTRATNRIPSEMNFNDYIKTPNVAFNIRRTLTDFLALKNLHGEGWIPQQASNWSITDDEMVIELRGDQTWHNGDPVTADDIVTQFLLDKYGLGGSGDLWNYVTSVEATSDTTVTLALSGKTNAEVLKNIVLQNNLLAPEHVFGEYVERLDGASEDERTAIWEEIHGLQLDATDVYCGPFKVEQVTESTLKAVPHEDHFAADSIDYGVEWKALKAGQQTLQALINGEIDAIANPSLTKAINDQLPSAIERYPISLWGGASANLNHNHKWLGDDRVRRALAYAIDYDALHKPVFGQESVVPTHFTGISQSLVGKYIPQDTLNSFTDYSQNLDAATSLLEDAGFEKGDDGWIDPDGDEFELSIIFAGNEWKADVGRIMAGQWKQFGVSVESTVVEPGVFYGERLFKNDFEVAIWGWGAPTSSPYPYNSIARKFSKNGFWHTTAKFEDPTSPPDGDPHATVEVSPVGDPNGAKQEYHLYDNFEKLGKVSGDAADKLIQEFAWIFNQTMPQIPLTEGVEYSLMSTQNWSLPTADDDPRTKIPFTPMVTPKVGILTSKQQ